MKSSWRTVRISYLYICGASAILSAVLLFVVHHMLRFAYAHVLSDVAWITRMMNWGINHIGTRPFLIFIGGVLFAVFFWIRSQKIAEDLRHIASGTTDLANGRVPAQMDVLSRGELRQMANHLNTIAFHMQENSQAISTPMGLPIKLTLYGVRSSLDEIIQGRCKDAVEMQHWVRLAYEQTLLLQHALGITELKVQDDSAPSEQVIREPKC
ncbi:hypothetical protein C0Q44_15175 [Paenibacillus sp. PCH8]|uniref:hypothetical protein n=1 Tax=Paenibacillus sp. PCH8 TaxID=2066524 RepID=UPI000CF930E7|nr:hypothetical protein [Paenibacillus sp. PCH8]PQP82738.1 hypothetical protein C0Q44_15175 [Paenibacillus sp. PCH8]